MVSRVRVRVSTCGSGVGFCMSVCVNVTARVYSH